MAHFAILRVQKLKAAIAVRRSLKHAFREQDTPNADAARTPQNSHFGAQSTQEAMLAFQARLPEKYRKDAVLAIEYLVTASPEVMAAKSRSAQDAYFYDALQWLETRHGSENLVYAGIHRDETTPHLYAYVVPRVGEKLNCRAFLGGAKALSDMQTNFAQQVGQKHGLLRGLEKSRAKHQTVSSFYRALNLATDKNALPALSQIPNPPTTLDKVTGKAAGIEVQIEEATRKNQARNQRLETLARVGMAVPVARQVNDRLAKAIELEKSAGPKLAVAENFLAQAREARLQAADDSREAALTLEKAARLLTDPAQRQAVEEAARRLLERADDFMDDFPLEKSPANRPQTRTDFNDPAGP